MKKFIYRQRVYFSDTDAQGIVYHARYLDFAEHARTEMARQAGLSGLAGGKAFVVRSMSISFERPAFLDDELTVETEVSEYRRFSLTFSQTIKKGDETVAVLSVKLAYIDIESKAICMISRDMIEQMTGEADGQEA